MPTTREEATPLLVPALRPRMAYSRLPDESRSDRELAFGLRRVGTHLVLRLAIDLPEVLLEPTREDLERWGLKPKDAFALARENLLQRSRKAKFQRVLDAQDSIRPAPRVRTYMSPWRDNLDGARLALPGLFDDLDIVGDPVVVVPNRDCMFVTGSDDLHGLGLLLMSAAEMIHDANVVSPMPVVRRDGRWEDWAPPAGSPLRDLYRSATGSYLATCYDLQQEALAEWMEAPGTPFVATVMRLRLPEGPGTLATWAEGVDSLLPVTDAVRLVQASGRPTSGQVALVPWDRLVEVCGQLLEPTELYPPRFRVRSFPDREQLGRLSAHALPLEHDQVPETTVQDALDRAGGARVSDVVTPPVERGEDPADTPEDRFLAAIFGSPPEPSPGATRAPSRVAQIAPRTAKQLAEPLLGTVMELLAMPKGTTAPPPPAGQAVLELLGQTAEDGWIEREVVRVRRGLGEREARRLCDAYADRWKIVDGACQLRTLDGTFLYLVDVSDQRRRSERVEDPVKLARFASLFASTWAEVEGERPGAGGTA